MNELQAYGNPHDDLGGQASFALQRKTVRELRDGQPHFAEGGRRPLMHSKSGYQSSLKSNDYSQVLEEEPGVRQAIREPDADKVRPPGTETSQELRYVRTGTSQQRPCDPPRTTYGHR